MAHPLVEQLRFTRAEFRRGLKGVTAEEGVKRFEPINSVSWIIGHLANQEQRYWLERMNLDPVVKGLHKQVGWGSPPNTPPLDEMWAAWNAITAATDPWLDTLSSTDLEAFPPRASRSESTGTLMLRVIHHYWYHLGEASAIRQMLGHTNLPQFVGAIGDEAPYRPE